MTVIFHGFSTAVHKIEVNLISLGFTKFITFVSLMTSVFQPFYTCVTLNLNHMSQGTHKKIYAMSFSTYLHRSSRGKHDSIYIFK